MKKERGGGGRRKVGEWNRG